MEEKTSYVSTCLSTATQRSGSGSFHGLLLLLPPVLFLYTLGWKGGLVYFSNPIFVVSLSQPIVEN